jgi:putative peptidoglycan lipid II flippase
VTTKEHHRILKATAIVGSSTFISRIFGYIRDMVVASFFGTGMAADAFFVAFRLPNLLRRLIGEGSMTVSFIPVFTDYVKKGDKKETERFLASCFSLLICLLLMVTALGVLTAPWLVRIIAPGFIKYPAKFSLTISLTRMVFPYIFFISLVAFSMGVLNTHRVFFPPAFSPVLLNVSMIGSVLLLYKFFHPPIYALAMGVLIGGVFQLAFQIPFLIRRGFPFKLAWNPRHPGLKKVVALMGPSILGVAVYQLTVFINTLLASFLPSGSVSYLYYADRLMQFPLGIFAIAMGTAALPSFSSLSGEDMKPLGDAIGFTLRLILMISIPASVGLVFLREPIIGILFQRGAFNAVSRHATALALLGYAVGLFAVSGVRVVVPGYYALKDAKTPVRIAVVALIVNVILGIALMYPLKHLGLALATSISSIVNLVLLVAILSRRLKTMEWRAMGKSLAEILGASAGMGAFLILVQRWLPILNAPGFVDRVFRLLLALAGGGVCYLIFLRVLRNAELNYIVETLKKRRR